MKNISITIICFFVFCSSLYSNEVINHSGKNLPQWIKNTPVGKYYFYFKGIGTISESLSDARKIAISDAISTIAMQGTIKIDSKVFTSISENTIVHDKKVSATVKESVISEVMIDGQSSYISDLEIEEEYWQTMKTKNGLVYQYWILMKVPKPGFEGFDPIIEQGYGFTPVLKSIFVPGWGQFHKGEYKKGWRFLISETVFVSSFFISNYFSQNYSLKAENERDYDNRKFYNEWSNRSYTIGTVSGIIAGSIYVYNVFDSITSKGAKKYALNVNKPIQIYAGLNNNQPTIIFSINL